jgi:hypothetical protein
VFGNDKSAASTRPKHRNNASVTSKASSHRLPKAERATLASVSAIPEVSPVSKQKNLNAKLARLNSLKRNYRAYLNSNDPKLASVKEYIEASLAYEQFSEEFAKTEETLAIAKETFNEILKDIVTYDDFSYGDLASEDLETRLADLEETDTSEFTEDQLASIEAEKLALGEALGSEEFNSFKDAEVALQEQQDEFDTLAESVSDESLTQALIDMANDNRVRQYGDEYVDEEMLDWAKQVLGVGDYYGKIDEIRETSEIAEEPSDDSDTDEDIADDTSDPDADELRLTQAAE